MFKMLGIHRNRNAKWYNWIGAWLELFDYLFSILTLGFFRLNLIGRWLPVIGRPQETIIQCRHYSRAENRVKLWIVYWIRVLELSLTILTLCYLQFFWCDKFLAWIEKRGQR